MSVLGKAGIVIAAMAGYLAFLIAVVVIGHFAVSAWLRLAGRSSPARGGGEVSEGARLRGRMKRMARRTLLLRPAGGPVFSQLGGSPRLPEDFAWPAGERGPRSFLCQLSLSEVHAAGGPEWLPAAGRLYFFHDELRAGFPDLVSVVHRPDEAEPAAATGRGHFPERLVTFSPRTSFPSLDWLGVDLEDLDVDDEELDELADLPERTFGAGPHHRIGGYPGEIQDEQMGLSCELLSRGIDPYKTSETTPAIERAAKSWRLLLQIDSDAGLRMNWGDGGRLYVFVREKHAFAGNFSKTITLYQTY